MLLGRSADLCSRPPEELLGFFSERSHGPTSTTVRPGQPVGGRTFGTLPLVLASLDWGGSMCIWETNILSFAALLLGTSRHVGH